MKKLILMAALLGSSAFADTVTCAINYSEAADGQTPAIEIKEEAFPGEARIYDKVIGNYSISAVKGREGEIYSLTISDLEEQSFIFADKINQSTVRKSIGTQSLRRGGETIHVECVGSK